MIQRVAIIGLGTMGPGIAARLARGGLEVCAYDVAPAAIERAGAMLSAAETVLDALGIARTSGGAVRFTDSLADVVSGADLVIENVPENIEMKAEVYRAIDSLIGPETIVASDTSGIPITSLQAHISHPERMVGMHWSNPPHIVPMIEVIAGERTAPETVATIRDLIRALGLLPVLVKKDVPGFVENRVLYALLREVVDLVERGVIEPEDVDTCVSWGIGYKLAVVGPMALLDMAGMDIYHSVSTFLNTDLADRKDVAPLVTKQMAAGKLGIKSGEGIYSYTSERIAELQRERARKLVAIRRILEGGE
ncbi:3-hydroxyacyl-CoA dehydrogenase family protein [Mesorhizobium sp. NBSH29]|uniref:5-formyl-3-hydroxy-2-methylpyridine 4-carboxylate 5-dehydrogenase n=1 Tax=Mesorhizobium sp. NBSH29 TaxID=2654249 RepID=UPI0018966F25|nr:5-formyl-3-hydroxy-2-methylpyridine 4-carboxylate 5-dehydrogenase [Mesorhizobium sp. NBSH29]QPC86240.1 3-hydroxyacyl-CoA dehydrogenase family protein [Mesorhizobium sp. NBSH29]